ncbi:MAG: lipoyl(octanoyl) transferase LipB [Gammaproteobacteria bacterium]|nr:octanoyltransferase [Gammaproteobacteria bacterium]
MLEDLTFKSLGLVNYHETLELMQSHVKSDDFRNEIWLLEHNPVFTLGTAANENHILDSREIPVVKSDRGGEVTYHGPGQLVVYFLLDVKKLSFSPKKLVTSIQYFVKSLLLDLSIQSNFIEGAPGVYVDKKKIASIGLRISNGKSYHGLSINFDMDLSPFKQINPCGYKGLEVIQINDLNKNISKLQLEKLIIDMLKNIF